MASLRLSCALAAIMAISVQFQGLGIPRGSSAADVCEQRLEAAQPPGTLCYVHEVGRHNGANDPSHARYDVVHVVRMEKDVAVFESMRKDGRPVTEFRSKNFKPIPLRAGVSAKQFNMTSSGMEQCVDEIIHCEVFAKTVYQRPSTRPLGGGIQSTDCKQNPTFCKFSQAQLPSCDMALWMGAHD
eukprot:COSAG01_NODE_1721_length_9391_cov_5.427249_7_plen_185_part_00